MAYALDDRGGGQALPPYLQGRSRAPAGPFQSAPMITPRSTVAPSEVKPQNSPKKQSIFDVIKNKLRPPTRAPGGGRWGPGGPQPARPAAPKLTPKRPVAAPTASAGPPQTAQTLYEYFKGDLQRQRDAAMSNARADASARGVFYGSPLTTSQGDIETEFQRGLGNLSAGLLQNEQGNELQRLQIAAGLLNDMPQAQAGGGISPDVFNMIGSLFAPRQGPVKPQAPAITPAPNPLPTQYNPNTPNFRR